MQSRLHWVRQRSPFSLPKCGNVWRHAGCGVREGHLDSSKPRSVLVVYRLFYFLCPTRYISALESSTSVLNGRHMSKFAFHPPKPFGICASVLLLFFCAGCPSVQPARVTQ